MSPNLYGMSRFQNKIALVTGGASGIGRATANRLAAEGAQVIIADNNPDMANKTVAEIEQSGGVAVYMEVNLADDTAVEAVGRNVAEQFPLLGGLSSCSLYLKCRDPSGCNPSRCFPSPLRSIGFHHLFQPWAGKRSEAHGGSAAAEH